MLLDNKELAIGATRKRKKMNFATTLVIGLAVFNFVALSCGGFILKGSSQPIDPIAEAKMIDNLVVAHYLANLVFSMGMLICYIASDED